MIPPDTPPVDDCLDDSYGYQRWREATLAEEFLAAMKRNDPARWAMLQKDWIGK